MGRRATALSQVHLTDGRNRQTSDFTGFPAAVSLCHPLPLPDYESRWKASLLLSFMCGDLPPLPLRPVSYGSAPGSRPRPLPHPPARRETRRTNGSADFTRPSDAAAGYLRTAPSPRSPRPNRCEKAARPICFLMGEPSLCSGVTLARSLNAVQLVKVPAVTRC